MLTLPNVQVNVDVEERPVRLSGSAVVNGYVEFPPTADDTEGPGLFSKAGDQTFRSRLEYDGQQGYRAELRNRNWRAIRERLMNLDPTDRCAIGGWLKSAGYLPGDHETYEWDWNEEFVTREIQDWIGRFRDVVRFVMELENKERFRDAVNAAHSYFNDQRVIRGESLSRDRESKSPRKVRPPERDFFTALKASPHLDPSLLQKCLMGAGGAPAMPATFFWNRDGSPILFVHADTPQAAIVLSIHIDKNFSRRQWVICANCGKAFEADRRSDRFCQSSCRNYFMTTARRKKLGFLDTANREWIAMSSNGRARFEKWKWLCSRVEELSDGLCKIDASWAKKQLAEKKKGK
jgi:hypothetical protein